ncbi:MULTISPECIES: MmgE/PrpD family protein [unclassified Ruegeria]|uniref:MmgE/PrpD family protein n=1 Tax=unclassified Ruegeria TaxID=2625375 RepID=UPI001487663F|nr:MULTISPECIES: MmgE/PrpD family protein [unclassified Ruegeria]NOD77737.1 MmgE/PrpD family protein [Ruegeria sp. HKCCD4332]NOD89945.1 MmgE/PrpD family protein [Ruegeria sp. HKCCD4318]NOE14609.1 MmgE/PrpD family protein [Ruegeria sp. HKCCD4318-2]NOG11037.1 MmgE/PrpD family protein [Ruegeria sp. HKCCD4315]
MSQRFDAFAAGLHYDDLAEEALWTLRRSFLDTMGVAAVGSTTELSGIARRVAPLIFGAGGAGESRMLMDGRTVSPVGAAMAGAFTVDSIDAHDGTTPCKGHAGSAIFPALIAMAQASAPQISGRRFAEVLATAYEISCRAGLAQHATCADYHTSGAWTAVGVAAAGVKLLGGTAKQIRQAAGIGEYHGPRSQMMRCIDHPTMVRDGVGWGAPSGVTAAYLAMEGFTGAPALTCEGEDAAPFWADLGSGWRLVDHTHYKAYPCCRWAHPSLDSVKEMMRHHNLSHTQIERVEIRTFHYATRLAGHEPANQDEFAYAIAFPVAAMIVRGKVGIEELSAAALRDPDILRVSRTIELIDDPEMTRISTDKRWAQVTLVLNDGRRIQDAARTPRGDADMPLSDAEIRAKFHDLADPVLGAERAQETAELALQFDGLDNAGFKRLLDLCCLPV